MRRQLLRARDESAPGEALALLRARLMQSLDRRPDNARLTMRAADTITRVLAAQHRIDPPTGHLQKNLAALLDQFREQFLPLKD